MLVRVPYSGENSATIALPGTAFTTTGSASDVPDAFDHKNRIKVLIVDNQGVTRAGLRHLIESYPDLWVVGEAGTDS